MLSQVTSISPTEEPALLPAASYLFVENGLGKFAGFAGSVTNFTPVSHSTATAHHFH
jgi:hypothetical protein